MTDELKECREEKLRRSFEEKYIPEPNSGCWLWIATTNGYPGYGNMYENGKTELAHRVSYKMFVGEIPLGFTIDHQCNTRLCVNPAHLKAMSHKDNNARAASPTTDNRKKTHCSKGHPLTTDNIDIKVRSDGVRRICKICRRLEYQIKIGAYPRPPKAPVWKRQSPTTNG